MRFVNSCLDIWLTLNFLVFKSSLYAYGAKYVRLGNLFWSQYIPADQILVSPITKATASPVHFQGKF